MLGAAIKVRGGSDNLRVFHWFRCAPNNALPYKINNPLVHHPNMNSFDTTIAADEMFLSTAVGLSPRLEQAVAARMERKRVLACAIDLLSAYRNAL